MGDVTIPGGKGTVTELGSHVPFIASWPGKVAAGATATNLLNFCDVMPTLAEIVGTQRPANIKIDGRSFAGTLLGKNSGPGRDWVFTQLGHKKFARDSAYLLHEDGRFYDLSADLFEKKDLSGSEKAEVLAAKNRLQKVLDMNK
jgi:arylsulfatase A